jgi:uncharacterized protein (TIGR02996 family)
MVLDRQAQWGLIRGILAEPCDDAPRLVYADWLEDQGDPLAEIVRVQTELRGVALPRARRADLQRRERELLDGLGFDRPAIPADDFHSTYWRLADGWDYSVSDGLATLFLHHIPPARDGVAVPPREWVERFGWFFLRVGTYDSWEDRYEIEDDDMRALLSSPLMAHCIGLDLHSVQRWYKAIEILARSPTAERLLRLDLGDAHLSPKDLTALASSPHLAGLLDLDISTNSLDDEAVRALATSSAMPALRRLQMSNVNGSSASIADLAFEWPTRFPELRSLNVSNNGLDWEGARELFEGSGPTRLVELNVSNSPSLADKEVLPMISSARLAGLRRLVVSGTRIGTATVEALCETDRFFRCGELNLSHCKSTDDCLAVLARSPHAALLRVLVARDASCTNAGAKALAVSPHLKGLRELDLSGCRIGIKGAEALTDPAAFPRLQTLQLERNPIRDRGAVALARWGQEREEMTLRLRGSRLTSAGVAELSRLGYLTGLEHLDLRRNAIGDEGVAALAGCPDLRSLRRLEINAVGLTDAGASLLAESPQLPRELEVWAFQDPALGDDALRVLHERFAKVSPSLRSRA